MSKAVIPPKRIVHKPKESVIPAINKEERDMRSPAEKATVIKVATRRIT